jgi:tetratricopeptide (TPR) repeat protein
MRFADVAVLVAGAWEVVGEGPSAVSCDELIAAGDAAVQDGRTREALARFDEVVQRFGDDPDPEMRQWVAYALGQKAAVVRSSGDREGSLVVRDELIERFGDDSDEYLRAVVSRALDMKARSLIQLGRPAEALQVRDFELARYALAEPENRPFARVSAVVGRAAALSDLGRLDESLAAWSEVLASVGGATDPEARKHEAAALNSRGSMLRARGEYPQALADLEMLQERFSRDEGPLFARWLAQGLLEQVLAWHEMGMPDPAAAALEQLLTEFGGDDAPQIVNVVTRALYYRAESCRDRGEYDAAGEMYDAVLERARETSDERVWAVAALAAEQKATLLARDGAFDDALAVLERGLADIAEHLNDDASYLTRLLWMQLSVLPAARGGEEVVRLADEVVDRLRDSDEPSTRLTLALALVQKFLALGMLGRPSESSAAAEAAHEYPEEALQVLDQQISAIDHDTDPSSGANFATRQMLRASILISLDRDEEGVEVLDSLIKQFAHADDPVGLELLKQARIARADLDLDE